MELLKTTIFFKLVFLCCTGGLAAQEPGQCFKRGPMWSHPHLEEETPEYVELDTCPAQKRSLETAGPPGEHLKYSLSQQHY